MKYSFNKLADQLERHEGFRSHPYKDATGHITIGIGRNLDDVGITRNEAKRLLANDVASIEQELLEALPVVETLSAPRQLALVNMGFNIGLPTLLRFENMIEAIRQEDWDEAANEMLNSLWAKQVGDRAVELSEIMRTGRIDVQ